MSTSNLTVKCSSDGVAMHGLLFGLRIIAGIFMVELENTLVSRLKNYLLFWKRYVDDTLCFVKKGSRDYVLSSLKSLQSLY